MILKPRIHWRPDRPISYPSGPGTMRTFVLAHAIVCTAGRGSCGDWAIELVHVTCKRCLKIGRIHRVDTPETIEKVLRRNDPLAMMTDGGES